MFRFRLILSAAVVLLLSVPALRAQLPTDSMVWKARCDFLSKLDSQLQTGTVPPMLVAATRGVAGQSYTTFGWDRLRDGDPNVACTLFYMALIADRSGNGGKPAAFITRNAGILAHDESSPVRSQLTVAQRVKRSEIKLHQMRVPALTSAQLQAVLDAATTMPISLTPPVLKP
jgi:hypothetical protein